MKIILIVFLLALWVPLYGQSGEEEILAYDDGNPSLTLTFLGNGGTFYITRFSPPVLPSVLTKLVFYVPDTTEGKTFFFTIYPDVAGEPGTPVLASVPMAASTIGWNEIDISEYDIHVKGDFYFQLGYDLTSKFSIGAENREPISRRTWDTDC
jgi:hypothetical protein